MDRGLKKPDTYTLYDSQVTRTLIFFGRLHNATYNGERSSRPPCFPLYFCDVEMEFPLVDIGIIFYQ